MHHPKRDAQGEDWDLENTNHMCIQKKINTSIKKTEIKLKDENENEENYSFAFERGLHIVIICQQNTTHTSPIAR